MSKLIVVSNRVAMPSANTEAGGLAVALKQALKSHGGIWCGWSGKTGEYTRNCKQTEGNVQYVTMDLAHNDYQDYYIGFCNSVLWPLFHYRQDLAHYTPQMFEGYERVNKQFAHQVAKLATPGDVIWVHDYHLLTLGRHLRTAGVKERLGFFLHIPFPVPEIFASLPFSLEILKGLCAYDLVGFQTDIDLQAFLRCVAEMAGGRATKSLHDNVYEITAFGRRFKAGRFAISIETADLMRAAETADRGVKTLKLKKSLKDRQMMIGVDRLDYTKGLVQRVEAFEQFLENYPEHQHAVSFLQITPPSRSDVDEYARLREELEAAAGRVNGRHSDIDWVPLRYLNKSFTRDELAGFYRTARVGVVTPLRDGMNLVAKEYVASQNPADPGVLVLSRFAGAAQELGCGALLINPHNKNELAEQMHLALTMPLEERKERYEDMITVLRRDDIFQWTTRFLHQLYGKDDDRIIVWKQIHANVPVKVLSPASVM